MSCVLCMCTVQSRSCYCYCSSLTLGHVEMKMAKKTRKKELGI